MEDHLKKKQKDMQIPFAPKINTNSKLSTASKATKRPSENRNCVSLNSKTSHSTPSRLPQWKSRNATLAKHTLITQDPKLQ